MDWIRLVTVVIVSAAAFGVLAWIVPGLDIGVCIAIGAGVGAAIGLSTRGVRRRRDR